MNKRSIKEKNRNKKLSNHKKVYAVEGRTNMTPKELLYGIRDKIQEILR